MEKYFQPFAGSGDTWKLGQPRNEQYRECARDFLRLAGAKIVDDRIEWKYMGQVGWVGDDPIDVADKVAAYDGRRDWRREMGLVRDPVTQHHYLPSQTEIELAEKFLQGKGCWKEDGAWWGNFPLKNIPRYALGAGAVEACYSWCNMDPEFVPKSGLELCTRKKPDWKEEMGLR